MLGNLFKAVEPGSQADYGLDGPTVIRNLALSGSGLLSVSILLPRKGWWIWLRRAGFVASTTALLLMAGRLKYSKRVKFQQRERILNLATPPPGARILDLGSGRGLLAIGAAKRFDGIKVSAVDIWKKGDLSGNSEEALRSNTDLEEVGGKIRVVEADGRRLPFADGNFDLIVSNLCIHNIGEGEGPRWGRKARLYEEEERYKALTELNRVLAPGGRIVISDLVRRISEYAEAFRSMGLEVEVKSACYEAIPPLGIVVANKKRD